MQIDELIVSLVLDVSGFTKAQKAATAAAQKGAADLKSAAEGAEKAQTSAYDAIVVGLNRLAAAMEKGGDQAEKQTKRQAEGNKKVAASFESAIRTGLTFIAVLAGARTVEQFTRQITALDAALGRTAYGMGQAPQVLSAIGKAVQRAGGDFNGAVGGLRALSDAYQDFRTTGSSALIEPLTRLQALSGKAVSFGKDTLANFESIADALQALDQKGEHALADRLGRQILGSDDLTNLAKRGGAAVRSEIAESGRHGVVDSKDVKAAQDLQYAYEGLSQSVVGLGTKIETALSPYLATILKQLDDLIAKHGAEWVAEFSAFLEKHKPDIESFGKTVEEIATSAGSVATAFGKQSPMVMALEAFAGLLTIRLLNPLNLVLLALRAIGNVPLTGALAVLGGANYLANNTMSNVDPWADQSAGETAMRAADPGLADRVYGKRGEQLPHGPHHGLGVKAQPHDTRNLWQKRPEWMGGTPAPERHEPDGTSENRLRRAARGPQSSDGTHVDPNGPRAGGKANPNFTPENAMAITAAAKDLGTTPEDLATVIGYETAGTYSPSKWGGAERQGSVYRKGGVYQGLIQFGPKERLQYGANGDQTFSQQMEAVKRYLKDRGFKPGMGLLDLYSTINAGSPGHYGASDRPGETVRSHVAKMQKEIAPTARAFVAMAPGATPSAPAAPIGDQAALDAEGRIRSGKPRPADGALLAEYRRQQNAPAPASHPDDDRASRARASDVRYGAAGHLSPVQFTKSDGRNPLTDLYKSGALKVELTDGSTRKLGEATVGHAASQFLHAMHRSQQLLRHAASVQHPPSVMHGIPHAMTHHQELMAGARIAALHRQGVTNHYDQRSTSEHKIGSLTVNTQAKDGQEVADTLEGIYQRAAAAGRRNYGQA